MSAIREASSIPTQARAGVRDYLLGRQCGNGGFSFYRTEYLEEPNPHDTWHALASLGLIGEPVPRPADTARFLLGQPVTPQPYALAFRVRGLALLGADDPEAGAVASALAGMTPALPEGRDDLYDGLRHLRLLLWLKQRHGQPIPAADLAGALLAAEDADGGFGKPANLVDTREALAVLALCGRRPSPRTADFVTRLATPGFGFRLTAESLAPTLETVCAGIACCRRLGLTVAHAADARAFILDCQTGNGGFARSPGALPDLALTHLALAGLDALAGPLST